MHLVKKVSAPAFSTFFPTFHKVCNHCGIGSLFLIRFKVFQPSQKIFSQVFSIFFSLYEYWVITKKLGAPSSRINCNWNENYFMVRWNFSGRQRKKKLRFHTFSRACFYFLTTFFRVISIPIKSGGESNYDFFMITKSLLITLQMFAT